MTTPPAQPLYSRHVLICHHGNCANADQAKQLYRRLSTLNQAEQRHSPHNPEQVLCSLVDCFGVCRGGPLLVVYPEGVWYHHVDAVALERIYHEHILGGKPVEGLIFQRLYPAGQEPPYPPAVRGDAGNWQPEPDAATNSETSTEPAPPPTDAKAVQQAVRRANKKKGLVIINTGTGKGKTTAALGVMTRAWGRQMRIGVLQFLKNENARYGETKAVQRMGNIDWLSTGDGFTWTSRDMDETEARARHGWEIAKEKIAHGGYDLFILDEFTYIMHFGWLDTAEVITWLRDNKPEMLHLIITGRSAPPQLVKYADLVTEMREIKHPFKAQGIRAQPGIEY